MRIISGICRGRKLAQLKGMNIRPTSDRIRESIFNIIGQQIHGVDVLELFAGTGAFGIESLSRGAKSSLFIDIAKSSCDIIRKNIELCGFKEQSTVFQYDASKSKIPSPLASLNFNLIFIDPPYEKGFVERVLKNSAFIKSFETNELNSSKSDCMIILEHSIKEKIPNDLEFLDIYDQRQYGKTVISFLKRGQICK